MNIPLQDWISANVPKDDMIWKRSWSDQVCFVRDEIPSFLCMDGYEYKKWLTIKENITVISTHTSKSIKLPVYCIKANEDTFIMRNNFYNWMVSVETKKIPGIDFQKLGIVADTSEQINSIYCEGFKNEWVYKPYDADKLKYTIEIYDKFKLKLFFWLIQQKDKIWEK